MKVLVTGASGNVGKGIIPRFVDAGHEVVLYDVNALPDAAPFQGLTFVQGDIQAGVGLDHAAAGCDAIVHTPAWHGIHWRAKTEADFWRLNVDGTFWAYQAAQNAGITRFVFLSSTAWYGHYDKYGFTKRVGEELCEYNRINHGINYVAIRPNDFTPWGDDYLRYGSRLLYGGVDRDDVLDCVSLAVDWLSTARAAAEGIVVHAVKPNVYSADRIEGWETAPAEVCESVFPGSRALVEKYGIDIRRKPDLSSQDEGALKIGYAPTRHFGTFIDDLRRLDKEQGEAVVRSIKCPY